MPINQTLEEQFRERFADLEEAPPPLAWNKIRQDIAPAAAVKVKTAKPRFKWLMPGSVIAVISMSLLFLLKFNKAQEREKIENAKEITLQAEKKEHPEQAEEITKVQPVNEIPAEKPAFKAYEAKPEEVVASQEFVKKRYLKAAENQEKPEKLEAKAAVKKLPATKVVYVVTVDPKSASVEKIATAETDSAATAN